MQELSLLHPLQRCTIELGDHIIGHLVEQFDGKKILVVQRLTPDYNKFESYLFSVDDAPSFANERTLLYKDRIYYSRIKNPAIKPVYISDEMLKKAGISV